MDQKSSFYPSINDIYIVPKISKEETMTMLLLPEDTKGNKQKACTSHFKSTSGQQFRDQSISMGGGGVGRSKWGVGH